MTELETATGAAEREGAPDVGSVFGFPLTLVLLAILLLIAAANKAADLTLLAASTLALMAAVRLWARISLSRLEVSLSLDRDRLFPGDAFRLDALIANRKALPVRTRLRLPFSAALTATDTDGGAIGGETALLPFERLTGSWTFRAERRGVHSLGPARIVAGDLMGLFSRERTLSFSREIVVFPRLLPVEELEFPFRDHFGIHPSKGIIEDPSWYEGTREYSGNKPARHIHWKASARLDALQEKIFEPTSHRKVFLLLDGAGYRQADDSSGLESALEILASLAARFCETGASFAAATDCAVRDFPAVLPLGRGPEHLGQVLELLARCSLEAGQRILPLLDAVGIAGAGFVVVARGSDDHTKELLDLTTARRDRALFIYTGKVADGKEDTVRWE